MNRLGTIDGLLAGLCAKDREASFLRAVTGEAQASFAIEGASLSSEEIEASVVASLIHRHALPQRRTDAIAELMLDARSGAVPLTADSLLRWHRLLFHGVEVEDLGKWRTFTMQIVRGPTGGPEDVLYHAPPPDRMAAEVDRFLAWLAQDTHPLPLRAALAHLWFESIHPFADGNGRIGRAIMEHVFATETPLPFSLSRQIEADKRGYYAALQAGRRVDHGIIDATPFVLWLLQRLMLGIEEAERDARFLVRRNAFLAAHRGLPDRPLAVLKRLFSQGQTRVEQGLSAGPYGKIAKISSATATRDLVALERQGVVTRAPGGGRSTRYLLNW